MKLQRPWDSCFSSCFPLSLFKIYMFCSVHGMDGTLLVVMIQLLRIYLSQNPVQHDASALNVTSFTSLLLLLLNIRNSFSKTSVCRIINKRNCYLVMSYYELFQPRVVLLNIMPKDDGLLIFGPNMVGTKA